VRMSRLLALYPPAWKRRYRLEMEAHLESEPASLRTAVDLIAGAIDAWNHPDAIPATPDPETNMITASRCSTADISMNDAGRSAAWMIGVTLLLTMLGVALDKTIGPHATIDALLHSSFFIALTISSRSTYLKPYSWAARNTLIGLVCVAWYAFFLAVSLFGQAI
jgi:hypothetical protein